MLEDLIQQDAFIELQETDWLELHSEYKQIADSKKELFISALAMHSGVPKTQIQEAFSVLNSDLISSTQQKELLDKLQEAQEQATQKIIDFQSRGFFKKIKIENLSITRTHWNGLISRFEQQNRQNLTNSFFLYCLSSLQKVNVDTLNHSLSASNPTRRSKRIYNPKTPPRAQKRKLASCLDDNSDNPFIYDKTDENMDSDLETSLKASGVRIASLDPATPIHGHEVKRTPTGGTKVRRVYTRDGKHSLFKGFTPKKLNFNTRTRESEGEDMIEPRTQFKFNRAVALEYTATLAPILERSGLKRRMNARSVMGTSAAEVFLAHGREVQPNDTSPKPWMYHWFHIIAHFLTDEAEIISELPTEALVNLIPSTAAANYNTLEAIELFIRDKLHEKETDKVHMKITPIYSGTELIPESLVYDLNWMEMNVCRTERFHIIPKSYTRLTKSMHQSINILRSFSSEPKQTESDESQLETFQTTLSK